MKGLAILACFAAVIGTGIGAGDGRQVSLPQHGISFSAPRSWHLTYERVNGVVNPLTIFNATTFPLRIRPADQAGRSGVCSEALQRAWRRDGAYVQLAEVRDGASRKRMLRRVQRRPRHFHLTAHGGGGLCTPPNSGQISFHQGGRAFYIFYGIGPRASRATRDEAAAVLDSLRIAARG
jgi:hypothetical protein